MTTFVLVAGAWHGPWAWDRVVPFLDRAGARTIVPDLAYAPGTTLRDHVNQVLAALPATSRIDSTTVPGTDRGVGSGTGRTTGRETGWSDHDPADQVILVGHSYAGLVVRQAADMRPDRIARIILVDGWAGPTGSSMFTLAPPAFAQAMRAAAEATATPIRRSQSPAYENPTPQTPAPQNPTLQNLAPPDPAPPDPAPPDPAPPDPAPTDQRLIPPPPPHLFGVTDPADAAWLTRNLRPHPLRTFEDTTELTGAVAAIPGTAIHCRPQTYPFERLGQAIGYDTIPIDGPHDIMVAAPEALATLLLSLAAESLGSGTGSR
ncbi:alpha/beta hydrolase [Actinomadura sp. ATCC 31491]|uniref:Alpha/beta hydrolase n=1 Tax=Actinomadura luzonensis TaxID=2805427 RepID=A0ABT0FRM5_9ACTN|nr:alpha/beta fold hydrolase [Actinomadura luzonensis]MCK2214991.1 alpha/beta hydrolase [Actinomadura luzonensis]